MSIVYPACVAARKEYAETIGRDGMLLLTILYDDQTTPQWLRQVPVVDILRQTWIHQYYVENDRVCWRTAADLPPAGNRFDSPYEERCSLWQQALYNLDGL